MITNCVFIGHEAGVDVLEGDGLVIIGDRIRTMLEGGRVAIGSTVFGEPCNLAEIVRAHLRDTTRISLPTPS